MKKHIRKTADWLVDYAHMLKGLTIMYLRLSPPKHYLGYTEENKSPIIILPGVFNRWAFMKPLADHLSLAGHPVYIVPKLGHNLADIGVSASKVKEVVEENDLNRVILVAHSKGGLIGKYLLSNNNQDNRIQGMVAIATPFSGSALAHLVPHAATTEMTPASESIAALGENQEVNPHIISIIPEYDNHVWHEQGSNLDNALENVHVPIRGHHKVIYKKSVWQEVVKGINKLQRLQTTPKIN